MKITLMIALRFNRMKTTASRFEKNLWKCAYSQYARLVTRARLNVRDEEVHETILEEEGHELGASTLYTDDELVHAHEQDDEIEAHGVDERRGENGVVGVDDHASCQRIP